MSRKAIRRESALLRFWRSLSAELAAIGEPEPAFGEAATLHECGYSVPQAIRVLAPGRRPALRAVSNF